MKAFEVIAGLRTGTYSADAGWALVEQVGNTTGAYTSRHIDAIAMGLWPSRGLEIHGIEVKVSRSDWKRELLKPEKAEAIAERCDRFFVATPAALLDASELPPAWGLIEVDDKGKSRIRKQAERTDAKPIDRQFLAAILRRVQETTPTVEMLREARQLADKASREWYQQELESADRIHAAQIQRMREDIEAFEREAGFSITAPRGTWGFPATEDFGRAVRYVANGGMKTAVRELETIARAADRIDAVVAAARAELAAVEEAAA